MKERISRSIEESILAKQQLLTPEGLRFIEQAAATIAECFENGRKVLIAGNGGSLCDAAHFSEELTGFFRQKRKPLPCIPLVEPGHLSCVSNDLGFQWVFSRAVEAYGHPGDLFIGLTTSGNSPNLVNAFKTAKEQKLKTIAFLGKEGGALKGEADLELIIKGFTTSDRIQEGHMTALHVIIEIVEQYLFGDYNEMAHIHDKTAEYATSCSS